jgi:hypothetical protein
LNFFSSCLTCACEETRKLDHWCWSTPGPHGYL